MRGSATRERALPWSPLAPHLRSALPQRWPAASACCPPGAAPVCSFLTLHAFFPSVSPFTSSRSATPPFAAAEGKKGATSSRCGARTKGATHWRIFSMGSLKRNRKHTSLRRKGSGTISSRCSTATGEAIDKFPASKKEMTRTKSTRAFKNQQTQVQNACESCLHITRRHPQSPSAGEGNSVSNRSSSRDCSSKK